MRVPSRRSGDLLSSTLTVDPGPGASRPDRRTTSRTTGSPPERHEDAQGEERREVEIGGQERAGGQGDTRASPEGGGNRPVGAPRGRLPLSLRADPLRLLSGSLSHP